ncbi:MAG: glycogen debranching protein [Barnesiella sp.]|nr:glycogen debranching protein [Barnesiella sp.]
MKHKLTLTLGVLALAAPVAAAGDIIATDAYRWSGDSIIQGEFKAYAPSDTEIVSDYAAQPHYFMPVNKVWKLRNDISSYPQLRSSNRLHNAIYNMGLDEMVNAVEPDTTLRTGKEWAGVWTRDVSYSIILSMSYLQPEASKISLMKKVTPTGRIVQDTGSGGAWPVSSDRMIWAVAAYELYKVTGDRDWLEQIYPIIKNSIEDDMEVTYVDGGVNGETSFIDWREQSYPKWMQTADIYASQAQNTGAVHVEALDILSRIAAELGKKDDAAKYGDLARSLNESLIEKFWMPEKGTMAMYTYGREYPVINPRSETLGQAFAIIYDQLPDSMAAAITENVPVTPYGPPVFFPQIKDMPPYHNNALWPWVASYWVLANAHAGNEEGVMEGIGSVFRPAALFTTNKENLNLDNGDIATELNSSNMLWCLAGNLAITHRVLFGIRFETDGLHIKPFVPEALADTRSLEGFDYRGSKVNITVSGYGNEVKSITVNGKQVKNVNGPIVPAKPKGNYDIVVTMADNKIAPMRVNRTANVKAPLTPLTRLAHDADVAAANPSAPYLNTLQWNPIEYIAGYIVLRDGKPVARTRETSFTATEPGVYQVIGVDSDGVESFASEPVNNLTTLRVQPSSVATAMKSAEVSYQPDGAISGFTGAGFAETDQGTAPVVFDIVADGDGDRFISLRYANGNGPVNTENKCAIRTVMVDGVKVGTVVMPQRGVGNWNDWGMTNILPVFLTAGPHKVTIEMMPYDENMNLATNHALIDALIIEQP